MRKIFLLIFGILCWFPIVVGQIPAGYYDPANGKTGEQLQSALHDIIKGHTILTYQGVWGAYYTTDKKPNGTVWDIYSDIPDGTPPYVFQIGADQCSTGGASFEGDCYTREHSFPKSWFGGEVLPMYTDIFHLYPTDGYVNGRRNDNPYGEVGTATWTSENGSMLGDCVTEGYSGTAFEPIDSFKGDLARTYFYMSTRYYSQDTGWPGSDMVNGAQLKPWAIKMMLRWNSIDPVSPKETSRNEAVFQIQHNRNPFIDHPEFVNLIWGNPIGIPEAESVILKVFPNPVTSECFIRLPDGMTSENSQVMVFSMTGQKTAPGLTFSDHQMFLDLQGLAKGVYYLQLTNTKSNFGYHARLIKE